MCDRRRLERRLAADAKQPREISALPFFPRLIAEARQAIERRELMPGRFIRVRCRAEQVTDQGDTPAVAAAMRIIGASSVETPDTKGTDGANVHLGGPETITGSIGGVGQPNDSPHFPTKKDIEAKGLMPALLVNYLDKLDARRPRSYPRRIHSRQRASSSSLPIPRIR